MKTLDEMGREFNNYSGADPGLRQGLLRAMEELQEALAEAPDGQTPHYTAVHREMCDVILTLASLANAWGMLLQDAVEEKHAINMGRRWGPHPTIPGAVQHIKETK